MVESVPCSIIWIGRRCVFHSIDSKYFVKFPLNKRNESEKTEITNERTTKKIDKHNTQVVGDAMTLDKVSTPALLHHKPIW
jgi:hypothetical protein